MRPLVGADIEQGTGAFGLGTFARFASGLLRDDAPVVRRLSPDQVGRAPQRPVRRRKPAVNRMGFFERWQRGEAPMRGAVLALAVFFGGTASYGAVLGGHVGTVRNHAVAAMSDITTAMGFGIREVRVTGAQRLTPMELVDMVGVDTGRSLLFFNAEAARRKMLEIPWIKTADVRKFYPGVLAVTLVEREPFALWQSMGVVSLVDRDGAVIGPYDDARFSSLPLVVGVGADKKAVELFAILDQYPAIRSRVRAAIHVAERRWNLKLSDGVEVKLPETDVHAAIAQLARLDKESGLLNRHIVSVDMRLNDRLTVRLAEDAAAKRNEAFRARAKKPGTPPQAAPATPAKPGRVT